MNKALRAAIIDFLKLELDQSPVTYKVLESENLDGTMRQKISYCSADGDTIPAYLWTPEGQSPFPAVLAHHQHHGQRYLGKSEIAGLAGDPLQAFGPELARRGFMVLAPDSICFEERRKVGTGIEPHERDDIGHYIEAGNRLTTGDTLMRKVLADASSALSLLVHHPLVNNAQIGVLGHSYGGNTVLFQAALDTRVRFAVCSGALCSYACKREQDIPLELALIIPDFATRWDAHHLLACMAPRPVLIVSASADQYTWDAQAVIGRTTPNDHITHFRETGQHPLTAERFEQIIAFVQAHG